MKFLFSLLVFIILSITATSQIVITTDSVLQTGTCAGSTLIVRYSTSGGSFGAGNKFIAQISNQLGQFANPIDIGIANFNLGVILATIPANAQFGFLYRIRVVSTNPAVVGSVSPNTVIITSTSLTASIRAQPTSPICPGDNVTLTALLPNATYLWSTGATTQSITIDLPGSYGLKVTDPLGCVARDTIVVPSKTGCVMPGVTLSDLNIYPNPVSSKGSLTLAGLPPEYQQVQLVDNLGRIVAFYQITPALKINLANYHLTPGVYHLRLISSSKAAGGGKIVITQ